jgi:hypothetical protein
LSFNPSILSPLTSRDEIAFCLPRIAGSPDLRHYSSVFLSAAKAACKTAMVVISVYNVYLIWFFPGYPGGMVIPASGDGEEQVVAIFCRQLNVTQVRPEENE